VGFGDEIDERPYARMVAKRYQTQHTELFIDQKIEDVVFDVLEYYDEPFGDSSAVPTHMISREARKHVKVILTGDGGDELFAGYDPYLNQKYQLFERSTSRLYKEVNRLAIKTMGRDLPDKLYPRRSWPAAVDHWLLLRSFYPEDEIRKLIDIPKGFIHEFFQNNHWLHLRSRDALSVSYSHDMNYYLPDDLLKKVDMASMLTSLECRAPFLDHRLIEFSLKIPPHLKVKNDVLKYLLKRSLKDYLPSEVLHRPKTGFGAPVESWVRKQLKGAVMDMLIPGCKIESVVPRRGIENAIRDVYSVEQCSDYRIPYKLWLLFVLEVWMRKYC
jgi:asparagine synthase (glutamine-hydrolysing)